MSSKMWKTMSNIRFLIADFRFLIADFRFRDLPMHQNLRVISKPACKQEGFGVNAKISKSQNPKISKSRNPEISKSKIVKPYFCVNFQAHVQQQ